MATLLVYSNSIQAGLVFDRSSRILQDARVQAATADNVSLIFRPDYWHPDWGSDLYRPLTTMSFLFNYAVLESGAQPLGYHAANRPLHALSASLLYLLGWRLLGQRPAAFSIAAIWAVHPVLTESATSGPHPPGGQEKERCGHRAAPSMKSRAGSSRSSEGSKRPLQHFAKP